MNPNMNQQHNRTNSTTTNVVNRVPTNQGQNPQTNIVNRNPQTNIVNRNPNNPQHNPQINRQNTNPQNPNVQNPNMNKTNVVVQNPNMQNTNVGMNRVPQNNMNPTVNRTTNNPQITMNNNPQITMNNNPQGRMIQGKDNNNRKTNRSAMNLEHTPTDRRSIVSFRQLEDTSKQNPMLQTGMSRRTIRQSQMPGNNQNQQNINKQNRKTLTPEEKNRRKTIRESIRQDDAVIQKQMHKFVQEMASIEEKMQQERKYNEELVENYNELLDILITTVTAVEELIPTYLKLKKEPIGSNFLEYEQQFTVFRQNIYKAIGEVHRNQAKTRLDEEKSNVKKPNAPPPPPPPSLAKAKGPAVNLLSEIHKGIALKKVDQDEIKKEHDGLVIKSVTTLTDLQNILSKALEERSNAIFGEDEDDWSDEDDGGNWQ